MSDKRKELDVDFIGDQNSKLTKEEEKAISEFIASRKKRNNIKRAKSKDLEINL